MNDFFAPNESVDSILFYLYFLTWARFVNFESKDAWKMTKSHFVCAHVTHGIYV